MLEKYLLKSFFNSTLHPVFLIPFFTSKKEKPMQQKILYIAITIIVLSVLFVLFRLIKNTDPKTTIKTETTYSLGKIQQLYKLGKNSAITKIKSIHSTSILKPNAADSTYNFTSEETATNFQSTSSRLHTKTFQWIISLI